MGRKVGTAARLTGAVCHVLFSCTAQVLACVRSQHPGHKAVIMWQRKPCCHKEKNKNGEQVLQPLKWKFICPNRRNAIPIAIQRLSPRFSPSYLKELFICVRCPEVSTSSFCLKPFVSEQMHSYDHGLRAEMCHYYQTVVSLSSC